jgi:hypothetical protein
MILAGHQPEYLCYIGFFHKMMHCNKFVLVDHVQFDKKSWQNRNRIRTKEGWILLTVPVLTKGKFEQKINEVKINNSVNWQKKHWRSILFNYKKAPFFSIYKDFFEQVYSQKWEKLVDLNETIIRYIVQELDINVEIVKSSEFNPSGYKTYLLIDMCKKLGADTYLSGEGGRKYVDEPKFKSNNIKSLYTNFRHPVYRQQYEPFIPNMSVIDIMFNQGNDYSREIIRGSGLIGK